MNFHFRAKLVVVATVSLLLMGLFPASFPLYITGGEKSSLYEAAATSSRSYGSRSFVWRRGGCFGCWTSSVVIRRSNKHKEFFAIRRSIRPSPPPPPAGARQRAMNVPPAPASASSSN
ncbi:hypothetical protein TorRG33x02_074140 [Trema orientale]|uniref:Transmembrane protein n=1 Tax=Trema orientale TaxID=63057 RepID=A0A2P5FFY8_TREOI|nr:hypothetical protein TorRG33x02_074140 [Trema orientale]